METQRKKFGKNSKKHLTFQKQHNNREGGYLLRAYLQDKVLDYVNFKEA